MGRGLRVSIPGGIYHVFQRGNNKEYIFADDEDKVRFINCSSETCLPASVNNVGKRLLPHLSE